MTSTIAPPPRVRDSAPVPSSAQDRIRLVAEIRTGDTWRNLADQLDRIKVVEYDHNGVRVRQTSEIDRELTVLLAKLGVPPPPKLHAVAAAPPAA